MSNPVKILLADDHSVVRRGVALILKESFPESVILHAETFELAMALLSAEKPEILILDINLPGGNNASMVEKAKNATPHLKILIFSAFDEEQYALRYIHAGADGYLNKLSSEEKISEAVLTLKNGGKYISDKVKDKILENTIYNKPVNPLDMLSNREIEIAGMLADGMGNLEIANRLNIQMSTVSTYKNRIFEKLDVSNVVSMVEKYRLYKE